MMILSGHSWLLFWKPKESTPFHHTFSFLYSWQGSCLSFAFSMKQLQVEQLKFSKPAALQKLYKFVHQYVDEVRFLEYEWYNAVYSMTSWFLCEFLTWCNFIGKPCLYLVHKSYLKQRELNTSRIKI